MREIVPGLYDWTTFHEGIGQPVHSHFAAASGTLIDPRVPEEGGVEAVAALGRVERIVLTNRHHLRHAERFVEAFGCEVLGHSAGLHGFAGGPAVRPVAPGDEPAPGVRVVEAGAITPEEIALWLDVGDGFLALGDIVIRAGGEDGGALMFVPDFLLGDDPEADKAAMTASLRRLVAEERFDGLLLAHGAPYATGGRAALAAFAGSE